MNKSLALLAVVTLVKCTEVKLQGALVKTPQAETFAQRTDPAKIDLLFVVDNSRSMASAQNQVAESIGAFFTFLDEAGVDYRVAVTSSDAVGSTSTAARGAFSTLGGKAIVTRDSKNAAAVIGDNIKLGVVGSNTETPLFTAMQALGLLPMQKGVPPLSNKEFLRDDAKLGIVFVTDEDDYSSVFSFDLLLALRQLKGIGNNDAVFLAGIVFDALELSEETNALHPERFVSPGCLMRKLDQSVSTELIGMLIGSPYPAYVGSICDDFAPLLRTMAIEASGFRTRFALLQKPNMASKVACPDEAKAQAVCVRVNGEVIAANDYTYDAEESVVSFDDDYIPPFGSKIEVSYAIYSRGTRKVEGDKEFLSCFAKSDCPSGVRCFSGRCDLSCTSDSQCEEKFTCAKDGSCRCNEDSACGEGEVCTNEGQCQRRSACLNNNDCGAGSYCHYATGECVPQGECREPPDINATWKFFLRAFDCEPGSLCRDGACVAGCIADSSCGDGATCRLEVVSTGEFDGACASGCFNDRHCCAGQMCNKNTGVCETKAVSDAIALCDTASCTAPSSACTDAGGACMSGFDGEYGCSIECDADSRCPKGYSCSFVLAQDASISCTHQGGECVSGRTCGATPEKPYGTCSCRNNNDCPVGTNCESLGTQSFCVQPTKFCGQRFSCGELTSQTPLLCQGQY